MNRFILGLSTLLLFFSLLTITSGQEIEKGDQLPDVTLSSTRGEEKNLRSWGKQGRNLVLVFYVKDQTPG